jgi:hypothetical protein
MYFGRSPENLGGERLWACTELHGILSQKTELMTTGARTLNQTCFFLAVRFEVLTAVVKKSSIFWDDRRFGGTYRLHLQCGKTLQARLFLVGSV